MTPGPGGQNLSGGTWTVQGGGGDIWADRDSFHYVWQTMAADGTVSAEVSSQTNTDPYAKAGVMIRATSDPGSPYYAVYVTRATASWCSRGMPPVTTPSRRPRSPARHTGLPADHPDGNDLHRGDVHRRGHLDADRRALRSRCPNLAGAVLEGLAVTSHNTGQLSTAVFNSVVTS